MTMKCAAASAPVMNHLRPKMRHLSPCRSARVWIMPGSEPPPGEGSVIANDEVTLPSTIGRSQRSFCAGVPVRASRFMLPSSGAMQLKASGPNSERAASSYTTAQATIGSAMPPNSFGACGAHRPALRAFSRTGARRSAGMFSCSEKFSRSLSSGSTCSSMKARTRTRRSSISGGRVKSIMAFSFPWIGGFGVSRAARPSGRRRPRWSRRRCSVPRRRRAAGARRRDRRPGRSGRPGCRG